MKLPKVLRVIIVLVLFVLANITVQKFMLLPLSIQPGCSAVLYMYVGYLWKKYKDDLAGLEKYVKVLLLVAASLFWAAFVIGFKSFWLVSSDYGRGLKDVIASFCAAAVVICLSYAVGRNGFILTRVLRYLGRHSLIALAAHNIALINFPWDQLREFLDSHGTVYVAKVIIFILVHLMWIFLFIWLMTRFKFTRKVFNVKQNK